MHGKWEKGLTKPWICLGDRLLMGDELVVAGPLVSTGAPCITWSIPAFCCTGALGFCAAGQAEHEEDLDEEQAHSHGIFAVAIPGHGCI